MYQVLIVSIGISASTSYTVSAVAMLTCNDGIAKANANVECGSYGGVRVPDAPHALMTIRVYSECAHKVILL